MMDVLHMDSTFGFGHLYTIDYGSCISALLLALSLICSIDRRKCNRGAWPIFIKHDVVPGNLGMIRSRSSALIIYHMYWHSAQV